MVKEQAEDLRLLSDEHFTVDGTLIEAWAGLKSFVAKKERGGYSGDDADKGLRTVGMKKLIFMAKSVLMKHMNRRVTWIHAFIERGKAKKQSSHVSDMCLWRIGMAWLLTVA